MRGWGSVLLGCRLPYGYKDVAQLLSLPLGTVVCPHPFLDELQGPFVLRDLEQLHGALLVGGKATHLSDHVPHELGVLGEAPVAAAVPLLAQVLCHFVAFVEAHGHGVVESPGCCSSMGPRRKDSIILKKKTNHKTTFYFNVRITEMLQK